MKCKKVPLFFFLFLFAPAFAKAQDVAPNAPPDSNKLYKDIQRVAKKHKVTEWIYESVFTNPAPQAKPVGKKTFQKTVLQKKAPDPFEGKIIRNINITTLDPFGRTVNDTVNIGVSGIEKLGNYVHIKSRRLTIKNQLLFKRGKPVDPLELKESERILRQSAYVRDARVTAVSTHSPDSVDVKVIVQDIWSITGSASASPSKGTISAGEKNFLGFGHQLNASFYYYPGRTTLDHNISYVIPYIRNTFITGRISEIKSDLNTTRDLSFNRDFYSFLTKYAGGLDLITSKSIGTFPVGGSAQAQNPGAPIVFESIPINYFQQDYWLGRSFRLIRGADEDRRGTRLLLAARYLNTRYSSRPTPVDSLSPYLNNDLFLGSVTFSQRTYYKDNYIYRFGSLEDVPEGRMISITGGMENKIPRLQTYSGIRLAFARHFYNFGYLSSGWEYGTYNYYNLPHKGVISVGVNYISDLSSSSWKWRIRHFISLNLVHGIDRDPLESINLNTNGIYGFSNATVVGTDKLFTNLQTVTYLPYRFIGFNFATLLFAGVGLVGDQQNSVLNSKLYQVYGFGLLIRNENLIINTIQLSFGFYPNIGTGGSSWQFNPGSIYDLHFRELFVSKPGIIPYQ